MLPWGNLALHDTHPNPTWIEQFGMQQKNCELGCTLQYELKLVDAKDPINKDHNVVVSSRIATPLF